MKQPLLILHGALGAKQQFSEWENALSEYFDCYLYEFAGYGERSGEDNKFSIELFSDELKDFIATRKLQKPNVLGYSMGGYVALYTALHNENLLGSIMTLATKFDWTPESAKKEAGYLQPALMLQKVPQLAAQLKQRHGNHWEKVVEKTAQMMLALGENPPLTVENISNLKNIVKFCVGDKDKMVSVQETQNMFKAHPKASFCVLPNTPHLPELMSIKRIVFEVLDFLPDSKQP